jgi:macrodomain Ter protein organizer (MatP/YcbG family)
MAGSKQVSIGMDKTRKTKLARMAKAEGRTLSNFVNRLIDLALADGGPRPA